MVGSIINGIVTYYRVGRLLQEAWDVLKSQCYAYLNQIIYDAMW
jgi:hypothetical protein